MRHSFNWACRVAALALTLAWTGALPAEAPEALRNWYNDPFFQVSAALARCPEPAGPRQTEAQRHAHAHHRLERGTSCWLSGECRRPNAYAYDQDIARALQASLPPARALGRSSLWITVQGRVVQIEGCSRDPQAVRRLEVAARAVPDVLQVASHVYGGGQGEPPYRTLHAR